MNKSLTIQGNREDVLIDVLGSLLKSEKIKGVLSLRKLENGVIDYGITTDISKLNIIEPFYPIMPANAGQLMSRFTPMTKPVAAVIKPCEFRAFVEMVKREQGKLDNFLIITWNCGGVYPIKNNIDQSAEKKLKEYYSALSDQKIPEGVRDVCQACEHIYCPEADIYIDIAGTQDTELKMYLQTEKAQLMLSDQKGEHLSEEYDPQNLERVLELRKQKKEEMFTTVDTSETGLDGLIDIFGKCIGCHGCNSVCPICYCVLCDFDSFNYDYNRPILEKELKQKGALRLPPDTLFFHLGRLSHMSFSCVGCGMCSDVCPANIPVAMVFKRTGEKTASMFNFVAGRSVKEDIPVMIFKEEEFPELGE